MREEHVDRPTAATSGERTGQWPGPNPAAERKADEVRENMTHAGPAAEQEAALAPDEGRAAATGAPTGTPTGTAEDTAPEQASAERVDAGTPTDTHAPDGLFEAGHAEEFQRRWDAIKATFVDDPRAAVRQAEELTDEVVRELTAAVDSRRRDLAERGHTSGDADDKTETERLRVVLHGYRAVLDPVLRR